MTRRFWVGFAAVILAVAGVLSYAASASPDGLDATTLRGCQVSGDTEELTGSCIAQHATDHHLAASPLADYTIGGHDGTVGLAGVIGVVVTVVVAVGLFWLIARGRPRGRN